MAQSAEQSGQPVNPHNVGTGERRGLQTMESMLHIDE